MSSVLMGTPRVQASQRKTRQTGGPRKTDLLPPKAWDRIALTSGERGDRWHQQRCDKPVIISHPFWAFWLSCSSWGYCAT